MIQGIKTQRHGRTKILEAHKHVKHVGKRKARRQVKHVGTKGT